MLCALWKLICVRKNTKGCDCWWVFIKESADNEIMKPAKQARNEFNERLWWSWETCEFYIFVSMSAKDFHILISPSWFWYVNHHLIVCLGSLGHIKPCWALWLSPQFESPDLRQGLHALGTLRHRPIHQDILQRAAAHSTSGRTPRIHGKIHGEHGKIIWDKPYEWWFNGI